MDPTDCANDAAGSDVQGESLRSSTLALRLDGWQSRTWTNGVRTMTVRVVMCAKCRQSRLELCMIEFGTATSDKAGASSNRPKGFERDRGGRWVLGGRKLVDELDRGSRFGCRAADEDLVALPKVVGANWTHIGTTCARISRHPAPTAGQNASCQSRCAVGPTPWPTAPAPMARGSRAAGCGLNAAGAPTAPFPVIRSSAVSRRPSISTSRSQWLVALPRITG